MKRQIDIGAIREIATALGELNEKTVFVGGAVVSLYVDVMSTNEVGWAPANKWFHEGFTHLEKFKLDSNISLNLLPLSFFLASKFEAFHARGNDPRTSHDLEDIIYLLDNRIELSSRILNSPENVLSYLRAEFHSLLSPDMEEAILGHMNPFSRKERYKLLLEKLRSLLPE